MYEVSVRAHFSAAHSIRDIGGNCENLHGHNFKVEVYLQSEELREDGTVMDFRELKSELNSVLDLLDHTNLNDIPPFDQINPSSENIAEYIYRELKSGIENMGAYSVNNIRVNVWESETSMASYFE